MRRNTNDPSSLWYRTIASGSFGSWESRSIIALEWWVGLWSEGFYRHHHSADNTGQMYKPYCNNGSAWLLISPHALQQRKRTLTPTLLFSRRRVIRQRKLFKVNPEISKGKIWSVSPLKCVVCLTVAQRYLTLTGLRHEHMMSAGRCCC